MWRRMLVFLLVFAVLQLTWQSLQGGVVQRLLVDDATTGGAAFLINSLTPQVGVRAVKSTLRAPGGGLNIINGCDGTETWFLLSAALSAASLPWRARLAGFMAGTAVVFGVNQVRILGLFYANRGHPGLFAFLHDTAGPVVVILTVAGFFHAFMVRHGRATATA